MTYNQDFTVCDLKKEIATNIENSKLFFSFNVYHIYFSASQFSGPDSDEPMADLERELPSEESLDENSYAMIRSILLAGFSEDSTEE